MRLLSWILVPALAVGAATWLLPGITLTGPTATRRLLTLLAVGIIFGLVNALVRPVVKLLTLPFIILTLGLLLLVINALMLLLTSGIAGSLHLGFHVHGFWTALIGAVIISLASLALHAVLPDGRRAR